MGQWLEGKTIVVGLSGGIACYKAAELVRLLRTAGARVRVVMTRHAQEFVTPLTMQTLSGEPVSTDLFDLTQESEIGHIRLADGADAIVVAPATANVIAKVAAGIGDDLLTTVLLATRAPVLLAPSMNVHMFENPVVQANTARLAERGYRIIAPGVGYLACGYEGAGRLADPPIIVAEVERAVARQNLTGEKVLVTAGPNRERIDPVRFISNRSTGKMGYAVAAAAWRRGADVVLISGPTALDAPHGVRRIPITTAAEMLQAVLDELDAATMLFMAAAVADYRPAKPAAQKIKKQAGAMTLELERTADVLAQIANRKKTQLLIGFAAETENVVENARRKLREKHLDMIVANDVAGANTGFEVDTNAVILIDERGREDVPLGTKEAVADAILDAALKLPRKKPSLTSRSSRLSSGSAMRARRRGSATPRR
jgi:phosphopantothenoylcysteine decarboxylase/phosphopantothenate--cysteine ligase